MTKWWHINETGLIRVSLLSQWLSVPASVIFPFNEMLTFSYSKYPIKPVFLRTCSSQKELEKFWWRASALPHISGVFLWWFKGNMTHPWDMKWDISSKELSQIITVLIFHFPQNSSFWTTALHICIYFGTHYSHVSSPLNPTSQAAAHSCSLAHR